jgi:predicted CXXCH cytochrome family protein
MHNLPRLLRRRGVLPAVTAVLLGALAFALPAWAGAFGRSAHGDRGALPQGCGSCHVGHGPPKTTMMPASQAATCLNCHGDPAGQSKAQRQRLLAKTQDLPDVSAALRKASSHPVDITGRPAQRTRLRRRELAGPVSKVTCADCHNPHYMVKAPRAGRSYRRVKQIGNARGRSEPEHDLCYRCHGGTAVSVRGLENIERLLHPGNPSYHPVEATGRNPRVPSLIRPFTAQSIIACTDCHGSDQRGGPRGPHGSAFEPILKAHFETEDHNTESAYQYALCYRCHSRGVLFSPDSFPEHRSHVVDERASCATCHDSHGSSQYPHLIDFDTKVVFSNSAGQRRFTDRGIGRGSCSLRCHEHDHVDQEY